MKAPAFGLALLAAVLSTPALGQSGFYLPTGVNSYGQDEFRAADGTTCRSTMDGTKRIELGAYGSGNRIDSNPYALPGYSYGNQGNGGNAGVYGRFSMSLDATPERMNCNALYKLELERRALELELMKRSLVAADRRLDELKQSRAEEPAEDAPRPAAAPARRDRPAKVARAAADRRGSPPP